MRLRRGPSRFWGALHRWGLARAHMPFWRVVVEARLGERARRWPENSDGAVAAVYVWARSIEEAEGLAALALEEEGFLPLTSDAVKVPPAAAPRRESAAVACGPIGFLTRREGAHADGADAPGARM